MIANKNRIKECANLWEFYRYTLWCGNLLKAYQIEARLLKIKDTNKIIYYFGKMFSYIK